MLLLGSGCMAEVKERPPSFELNCMSIIKYSIWPTFYQELVEPLG